MSIPTISSEYMLKSGAILTYISWILTIGLWSTLLWFVKKKFLDSDSYVRREFERIIEHLGKIEQKQDHQKELYYLCRNELPRTFATKESFDNLYDRLSKNEQDIATVKAHIERCMEALRKRN